MRLVITVSGEQKVLFQRAADYDGLPLGPWMRMQLLSRARNSGISDPVKEARREARHTARAAHAVGVDARRAKRDRRRDLSGLVAEAHKRWTTAMEAQFVPGCDDVANGVEIKESRAAWDALRDEAVLIGK